jgi:hypothetical protein
VCIGFPKVDGWLSPRANASVTRTNDLLKAIMAAHPRATYVATDAIVHRWDDYLPDHVHLNLRGHRNVSTGITDQLTQTGLRWAQAPAQLAAVPGDAGHPSTIQGEQ